MTDAQRAEGLRKQMRDALEWLLKRPDTPTVREMIATFRDALK